MSEDQEGFVSRWSRRKQQVMQEDNEQDISSVIDAADTVEEITDTVEHQAARLEALNSLTDEDMPDVDTLNEDSDFSGFMSTSVSESLRQLALKKLFMGKSYNIRDGLDEYDGDYTTFEKMPSDMITSDMKHMVEVEAKKQLAKEQAAARQKMLASGELDEFADEEDEKEGEDENEGESTNNAEDVETQHTSEKYVDELINVEGFDTTTTTDENNHINDDSGDGKSDGNNKDRNDNHNKEVT